MQKKCKSSHLKTCIIVIRVYTTYVMWFKNLTYAVHDVSNRIHQSKTLIVSTSQE